MVFLHNKHFKYCALKHSYLLVYYLTYFFSAVQQFRIISTAHFIRSLQCPVR